jgi:hypothetical protein
MGPLARKALEAIKAQGGRVIDHDLIDRTFREINETYRPGLIGWLKEDRPRWRRLLNLEDGINRAALAQDEAGLKDMLSDYRDFFVAMLQLYGEGETLPLFGTDKKEEAGG